MAQRARKCSRASCRISGVAFQGFFSLRAPLGIARLRTVRATAFSREEGSSMALKPRRITTAPYIAAATAAAKSARRNLFQLFLFSASGENHRLRLRLG